MEGRETSAGAQWRHFYRPWTAAGVALDLELESVRVAGEDSPLSPADSPARALREDAAAQLQLGV